MHHLDSDFDDDEISPLVSDNYFSRLNDSPREYSTNNNNNNSNNTNSTPFLNLFGPYLVKTFSTFEPTKLESKTSETTETRKISNSISWTCHSCTYINGIMNLICEICSSRNPTLNTQSVSESIEFEKVMIETLFDKRIVLLFGNSSSETCVKISHHLLDWYNSKPKDVEVVFVFTGDNKMEFQSFFGNKMPWLATPFSENIFALRQLRSHFDAERPETCKLVVVNSYGHIISSDAIESLNIGEPFPWKPIKSYDIIKKECLKLFLNSNDSKSQDSKEELKESIFLDTQYIGLYIVSRNFPGEPLCTDKLIKWFKQYSFNQTSSKSTSTFQIVGLVRDYKKEDYEYFSKSCPWPCIPYQGSNFEKIKIHEKLENENMLMLFDQNVLIKSNMLLEVITNPISDVSWITKKCQILRPLNVGSLVTFPTLLYVVNEENKKGDYSNLMYDLAPPAERMTIHSANSIKFMISNFNHNQKLHDYLTQQLLIPTLHEGFYLFDCKNHKVYTSQSEITSKKELENFIGYFGNNKSKLTSHSIFTGCL